MAEELNFSGQLAINAPLFQIGHDLGDNGIAREIVFGKTPDNGRRTIRGITDSEHAPTLESYLAPYELSHYRETPR